MDPLGIRYGLTTKAWIARASPSAVATISTSSTSEPGSDASSRSLRLVASGCLRGRRILRRRRVLGGRYGLRTSAGTAATSAGTSAASASAPPFSAATGAAATGGGACSSSRSTTSSGTRRAALTYAGPLADAIAKVVQLGPPDVAAGGDLDPLDLRRVKRERPLDADAEGLLAHGEGLPGSMALALDHHALEHLGAAAGALDDLEVDAQPVPGVKRGHSAELRSLQAVDHGAHGK